MTESANLGSQDGRFNGMGQGAYQLVNVGHTPSGVGVLTQFNPDAGLTEKEIEEREDRIRRGAQRIGRHTAFVPSRIEVADCFAWDVLTTKLEAKAVIVCCMKYYSSTHDSSTRPSS